MENGNKKNSADSLLYIFPKSLRALFGQAVFRYEDVEEIRLRGEKPVIVKLHTGEKFLDIEGRLVDGRENAYRISTRELLEILNQVCKDSVYAFEDELKQGFLTVMGGHRIGITGQVVVEEDGRVRTIKHVSGMNVRVAHEVKGAADKVLPYLYEKGSLCNTLIISPPGCGKTTLLRDIIRQVSDGNRYGLGMSVGVVDERSEIAGSCMGEAQNDVGIRTDILDACPKVYGMMMLIRSMAPQVVAIDELGGIEDVHAMKRVSACGSRLLATIHGFDLEEMQNKEYMKELLQDRMFSKYIVLEKENGVPGVRGIFDKELRECFE